MSRQGEQRPRTPENVRDFWNREAAEWGESPQVTIRDHYFRLLEIDAVCAHIRGRQRALDIGCGSGFSTLFYADAAARVVGVDFADEMIDQAQRFLTDRAHFAAVMREFAPDAVPRLDGNVTFQTADVLALDFPDDSFDAVVGERLLINLPTWELQKQGFAEMARVLEPRGVLVSAEVTVEGHAGIDACRQAYGLPQLEKYWHNLYLNEDVFLDTAAGLGLELREVKRFETYQFLTKVLHPLVTAPDEPRFLSGFNDAARRISLRFPTYESVLSAGFADFLHGAFAEELAVRQPDATTSFERVAKEIEHDPIDFSRCSHQVLFVYQKTSS